MRPSRTSNTSADRISTAAKCRCLVALAGRRPETRTFGLENTWYTGALKPWQIFIPPGVGHGYKAIGEHPGMLVYVTNRLYNPADEGRIAHNQESIAYDWELQHK